MILEREVHEGRGRETDVVQYIGVGFMFLIIQRAAGSVALQEYS